MSELKPCPFCGGEAVVTLAGVSCSRCQGTMVVDLNATEQDAIDAWNTRAERTCEQVDVTEMYKPYTTHMTKCSECGGVLAVDEMPAPNYCPICGAKVER